MENKAVALINKILRRLFSAEIVFKTVVDPYLLNKRTLELANVEFNDDFTIRGTIEVVNKGKIKIGKCFSANSGSEYNLIGGDTILRLVTHTPKAELIIGDSVGISNSTIVCWDRVEIGNNVLIGGGVKIWDTNFHSLNPSNRFKEVDDDIRTAPIKIKDFAFVGASTIILKGVTIGSNSIIAAGSVVIKDIPDNVIAGGNPCRVIKSLNPTKPHRSLEETED